VRERNRSSSPAALLEGSQLVRKGGADVFRQRERTRLKKVIRAVVVVFLFDYLLYRWLVTHPNGFDFQLPPDFILFLPGILIVLAIVLMLSLPLISGRSPHVLVHPEQVEVGLSDIKGLDHQVDEVIRSLEVFLGYATFRDELGGTPRRGILFEGPPGTGKTFLAKAMAKQAGVPFLFIPAPAFQSMWQGMSAFRIRSFFKRLRKIARKEGGAIGFIEEIDAIGQARDASPATPFEMERSVSRFMSSSTGGMVNELLIQMQSFDQPPWIQKMRDRLAE
jgi:ATP-dependent Zn protease